jgi:hypothetical protein
VPDSADYSVYYDVEAVVPPPEASPNTPAHILLHSVRHVFGPIKQSDFTWVFALVPTSVVRGEAEASASADGTAPAAEQTRLIIRARVRYQPLWAFPVIESMLNAGDLVNVSAMLRTIRRAERNL